MLTKTPFRALSAAMGALVFLHGPEAVAQTATPAKKDWVVSGDELIRIALTNNLDIRISRLQPQIDEYGLNGLYGAYEPSATLNATHNYDSFPPGVFTQAGLPYPGTTEQINSYTPGVSGFAPWGLSYNFSGPFSEQNVSGAPDLYSSSPGVTLSQPLLKNFWIDNARYQISLGKKNLKLDQLALRLQIMTVINNVMAAYYNLIGARENVSVQQMAVKLAEETMSEDEQRVRAGALAPLDEMQAESQAASARSDLLAAQATLAVQENAIKSLLALRQEDWASLRPVPAETLVAVPEKPEARECWRAGLEQRPDMQQAKLNIEKQHLTIKYNFNQLFPEIDVVGSYGRNATDLTFNNNLESIRQGNYPYYSFGVMMTIPLGNSGPRNSYKAAKAGLEQLLLQARKVEWSIVTAIDNDIAKIQSDLLRVDSTRQAREYAEEALQAEQVKLQHGKNTSFFVLQAQQTLTARRSDEIQALASYNIDLEQLSFDDGRILERNHIELRIR
jgi:outer membrane protein TolC